MKKLAAVLATVLAAGALQAGRPVAKWDVIPYQRVNGVFKAGVVAFHEKPVTVTFKVDGKSVHTATKPELNPRTKVWEFVLPLDTSKYKDGELKLGATASVDGEDAYELPEIVLYANSGKTVGSRKIAWVDPKNGNEFDLGDKEHPVKTIRQGIKKAGDGGYVLLLPGDYQAKLAGGGMERKYWTTVMPAPGVKRSQVKIEGGRTGTDKLKFFNVEFFCDCDDGYDAIVMGEGGGSCAWFDNCRFTNKKGRYGGYTTVFGNKLKAYVTGGVTEEMSNGPCCEFVRGHTVRNIACDAFSCNNALVINSSVDGIDATGTGNDPDVFNGFSTGKNWTDDVILYNVKATDVKAKGLAGQRLRNCAFVNVVIENSGDGLIYSRFSEEMENVLFAHLTLVGQKWQWMQTKNGRGDFKPTDVKLINCVFEAMEGFETGDGSAGLAVKNSAFYKKDFYGKTETFGTDAVVVERPFADEGAKNFALPEGSAGLTAGMELQSVPVDVNGVEYPAGQRPCGAYAK